MTYSAGPAVRCWAPPTGAPTPDAGSTVLFPRAGDRRHRGGMSVVADLGLTSRHASGLLGLSDRLGQWVAPSTPAVLLARTMPALDALILTVTRGRTTFTEGVAGLPTIYLTTRGASTGQPRAARVGSRAGHGFTDLEATRRMYQDFLAAAVPARHIIDDEDGEPEVIASEIVERVTRGELVWRPTYC
jgi:hypothetical protein